MKLTVVITVWKRERFLPHAIQSVLVQTHRDWEILVYSDGRSRRTREVVDQLREEVPIRYRALARKPRLRGNHLRRAGLEDARGSHVCVLGHDCILYPSFLETHARTIGDDPDAVSVVPVDYWKDFERRGTYPRGDHLRDVGEGEIDLLCVAFPRRLSLATGCFGPSMRRFRHADYLSFDLLRKVTQPVYADGPTRAAHF